MVPPPARIETHSLRAHANATRAAAIHCSNVSALGIGALTCVQASLKLRQCGRASRAHHCCVERDSRGISFERSSNTGILAEVQYLGLYVAIFEIARPALRHVRRIGGPN